MKPRRNLAATFAVILFLLLQGITVTSSADATLPREAEDFAVKSTGVEKASSTASGGAYWKLGTNGHIEDTFTGDGVTALVVLAKGTTLGGVGPTLVVSVDGAVVRTHSVSATDWAVFGLGVLPTGTHSLRLAFTNDAKNATENRNLFLDVVRAKGVDATVTVGALGDDIDPRMYSFNVVSWEPRDYSPPNATFVSMLKQLRPALLRFPPGHDGQHMYFDSTNTLTSPPAGYTRLLRAKALDDFVSMARQVGAEPMLEVNLKTGTKEMAASLVHYVNVKNDYDIEWFELGNEPDLNDGYRTDPATEARKFQRYAAAMRAEDPDIKLVGGVIMSGANAFGTNGRQAWLPSFSRNANGTEDALSWHWYPLDSNQPSTTSSAYPSVKHLLQENAPDWRPSGMGFAEEACAAYESIRDQSGAEHWITEIGPDSGSKQAPGITNGQVAAVWIADALPRLAECGVDALFQFAVRQQAGSVLVLMTHDRQPTPQWGAYQLLAEHYRGQWIDCTVQGAAKLSAHAAEKADGSRAVILSNKGAQPLRVNVDLGDATLVDSWTLEADTPTSTQARINGAVLDRNAVINGFPARPVSLAQPIDVPAYSVVVLSAAP